MFVNLKLHCLFINPFPPFPETGSHINNLAIFGRFRVCLSLQKMASSLFFSFYMCFSFIIKSEFCYVCDFLQADSRVKRCESVSFTCFFCIWYLAYCWFFFTRTFYFIHRSIDLFLIVECFNFGWFSSFHVKKGKIGSVSTLGCGWVVIEVSLVFESQWRWRTLDDFFLYAGGMRDTSFFMWKVKNWFF